MKRIGFGPHGRLLFRSYLILVAALVLVATILDFGFDRLQSAQFSEHDPWRLATLDLIEAELGASPERDRDRRMRELSDAVGIEVNVLQNDEVVMAAESHGTISVLSDADGNRYYLRDAPSLNAIVRLGPVEQQRESLVVRLLPPLFYLSIFVVVGLWLRPFFRDINLISSGAEQFAADYRKPIETAATTTQLTDLAGNLDDMSSRLSGLIQSQKELIAALSHEMRTPLARIRFALAVINKEDRDELRDRIAALDADVQEIDDLIASMLNYARLDHPDLQMNWQDVSVKEWLAEAQEKVQSFDDIQMRTDIAVDEARMDPRLMNLAISNLLVNACRYAKREVRCSVSAKREDYEIRVDDDGTGIPDAERESIFKAFTRIDDSRNRETGGFGLGLAIVARIAALHGGEVSVHDSEALGGACFVLTWPRRVL